MSEDVLGQPWEETMSELITAFRQITAGVFDAGESKYKIRGNRSSSSMNFLCGVSKRTIQKDLKFL